MNALSVPRDAIVMYNRALELSNKGELQTALDEYRRALGVYPSFVDAYNNIGEIYSRLGDSDRAIATYREALGIEKHFRVLLNLGVEYYQREEYDSAQRFFAESIALKPDFIEGNYYMGLIYYNRKEYATARDYFNLVMLSDRRHLKANLLLSAIHYEWKEYARTIEHLDNVKDLAEDKAFLNRYYGFCHYYLGDYEKAVTFLSDALRLQPNYEKFKNYLAGLNYENRLQEIGDLDKAIKELERKRKQADLTLKDATRLSMLYIFKGKNNDAERLLLELKDRMAA